MKVMLRKQKLVIPRAVQSTANGDRLVHGCLAPKHAVVERNLAQDQLTLPHQMEDYLVKEKIQKQKLVIRKAAQ